MFELQHEEQSPTRVVLGTIARSLPSLAVGLFFVFVGYTKFGNDPRGEWVQMFERIGLGQWFRIFTGVVQVSGGVLMLWPRARTAGAALLACTMVGAIIVDLFIIGSPMFIVPMMLLFLIAAVWAVSL
jgi:putative oxidoreductase